MIKLAQLLNEVLVKNKKTGNVYNVVKMNPQTQEKPKPADIKKAKDSGNRTSTVQKDKTASPQNLQKLAQLKKQVADKRGNETSKTSFKDLKPKQIEKAFDEYMDKNYPKIADKWGDTNGTIDSKTGRFYITTIPKKGGLEVVMFDSVGGNPKEKHYAEAEGPIEKKNWGTAPTLEKAVELYKAAVSSDEWKSVKSK
jgi:hypothetical protein